MDLNSILLFSDNPDKLVAFYQEVFQDQPDWSGGDFKGFKVGSGTLVIGPHDEVSGQNENPERLMFNIETDEIEKEFERIKDIDGADVIAELYHPSEDDQMWIATFADPDNNYFQIASPMRDMM